MTKTIFDTMNFYGEREWYYNAYEDDKEYFHTFLNELIQSYEKKYRTKVRNLALVGRIGLWNGNPVGGKIMNAKHNPIEHMGNVDNVDITIDDEGIITLHGHHHDGMHRMNIYLLTEYKLRKVSPNFLEYGDYDYEDMERIYEDLTPLKCSKKVELSYYGPRAS